MSIILQFAYCIVISFLVWFILGVILLSPQFGILGTDLFGPANTPISTIFITALGIGLTQGFLMSLLNFWYKPNTMTLHCFYSFIATEIILLLSAIVGLAIVYLKEPVASGISTAPYTSQDVFRMIFIVVFWYLVLSLVFLLPSLIIGFATKKILELTAT